MQIAMIIALRICNNLAFVHGLIRRIRWFNLGASVLWRNFKKELHVLVCTDKQEYAEVRKKVRAASKVTKTT